jgi:CRP/FNR family transcriptional regulator, cyclic AMP receptor protein
VVTNPVFVGTSPGAARLLPGSPGGPSHWIHGVCEEAMLHLGDRWVVKRVAAGATVMRAQTPALGVCLVLRGTLRVRVATASSTPVTLALVGPGEVLGEMALLDGAACATEVTAVENCELAWIDRETFRDALACWPRFSHGIAELLARRLRQADRTIYSLVALEVDQRVAQRVLDFAETYGEPDGELAIRLPMRITQHDLAAMVGASRERTNRALMAFKRRGWIAVDAQMRMTLLRPDLLARRVQGPGQRDLADL